MVIYYSMDNNRWNVTIAERNDFEKWMEFAKNFTSEFHGIDLSEDEGYISGILKNINRSTAIYIRDEETDDIVGTMIYSPNSMHIGWIAVRADFRRMGIGSVMVNYMFSKLPPNKSIKVKTFLETDTPGKTAHSFYKSLGFLPKEIIEDVNNENAGKPFHLFIK